MNERQKKLEEVVASLEAGAAPSDVFETTAPILKELNNKQTYPQVSPLRPLINLLLEWGWDPGNPGGSRRGKFGP